MNHASEDSLGKEVVLKTFNPKVTKKFRTVESRTLWEEIYSLRQWFAIPPRWEVRICNQSTVYNSPSVCQYRTVLTITNEHARNECLQSCFSPCRPKAALTQIY